MTAITHRFWKMVGESGAWKGIGKAHAAIYRLTGGKVGHGMAGLTNLLLTTTGARSGKPRVVPLTYMADGDDFVLVASNGGADRHPAWYLNLVKHPVAVVQVGATTIDVTASNATPAERARLWPKLKTGNPFYAMYEKLTEREIPVVVLRRVKAGA